MKIRCILGTVIALFSTSQALASSQDYKCYVELHDKTFHIAFVDGAIVKNSAQASQQLLNQGFYAADGKQVLKVKKVIECQSMLTSFINVQANLADERTPR